MERRNFLRSTAVLAAAPSLVSAVNWVEDSELAAHIIENIQVTKVKLRYPRQVGKNSRLDVHGYGPEVDVVELTTNRGASGWAIVRDHKNVEAGSKYIKGRSLREVFTIAKGSVAAVSSFDFALYDLAGTILNKPVYELIGTNKEPITTNCYSGMIYFDDLEPSGNPAGIDAVLKNCQWDYEYGYRQFKIKIGRGGKWMSPAEGLKRDIDVTKAIAELFPDVDILVDANDAFDVSTTIKYIQGIGETKLFWIEEPFREELKKYTDLTTWLHANGRGDTLLADGEANPDLALAMDLGSRKLLQVYLADMSDVGFSDWRKLNMRLKNIGMLSSPHCWGDLFKTYYTSHLIAAQGNSPTIEGVTCLSDDIDFGDYQLKGKHLVPSRAPGFGMKLLKKNEPKQ